MAPKSTKTQAANGTSNDKNNSNKQTFSFDIVAALLLILRERGVTISRTHYELMSALDGHRTADAFQHQFRAVLARAKALHAQREDGVAFEAVKPMPKGRSKGGGQGKRKRGGDESGSGDGDEDGDGIDDAGDAGLKNGKKKTKSEFGPFVLSGCTFSWDFFVCRGTLTDYDRIFRQECC